MWILCVIQTTVKATTIKDALLKWVCFKVYFMYIVAYIGEIVAY